MTPELEAIRVAMVEGEITPREGLEQIHALMVKTLRRVGVRRGRA
jgi:hypothetical protein